MGAADAGLAGDMSSALPVSLSTTLFTDIIELCFLVVICFSWSRPPSKWPEGRRKRTFTKSSPSSSCALSTEALWRELRFNTDSFLASFIWSCCRNEIQISWLSVIFLTGTTAHMFFLFMSLLTQPTTVITINKKCYICDRLLILNIMDFGRKCAHSFIGQVWIAILSYLS